MSVMAVTSRSLEISASARRRCAISTCRARAGCIEARRKNSQIRLNGSNVYAARSTSRWSLGRAHRTTSGSPLLGYFDTEMGHELLGELLPPGAAAIERVVEARAEDLANGEEDVNGVHGGGSGAATEL